MKNHSPCIEPLEARIAPAFGAVFELSSLDGSNGFTIDGAAADDRAGRGGSAGDVNGDGFDDMIVIASGADPDGAIYVIFGDGNGFTTNLNLSTLDGNNGFKLSRVAANQLETWRASAAGDMNGDGFGDLILGAPDTDPDGKTNAGVSYVVFGKASPFAANLDLSTLDGSNGFTISGSTTGDFFGCSVSTAGDVNGDGFDDLIIGARGADPNGSYSGASYVLFGKASGFTASFNLSTLDGSNGFRIVGAAYRERSGYSVDTAGDVNGDGFADLIVGAPFAGSNNGASYVVFGKGSGFAANLDLSSLNGSNGFRISGVAANDFFGYSVSTAGDVNGDGFDDMIIGARDADPNGSYSGASYVLFGKAAGFPSNLDLSLLNGSNGFKLRGVAADDQSGISVSAAGDVNGDGFDDVIIGAFGADPNGSNSGSSYVVFGKASGFAANLDLSSLDGSNGFRLNGVAAGDRSGISVSTAADVNGDDLADLIIGASSADPNGILNAGSTYVVFGQGAGSPLIRIGDASLTEGNAGTSEMAFSVTLSFASPDPVTVQFSTADGTASAGSDYAALLNQTLQFAPGERSKMVAINVSGDVLYEANETFSVVLSNATGATIGDGTGVGTIINDDAPPLVSIAADPLLEGDSGPRSLVFSVSLSAASGLPATVNFASADGTALAGSDYTALTPGTLSFAPGEMSKTISVEVLGDTNIEAHEQFSVILSQPNGATIGSGTAIGTILNDDTAIRISDVSAIEGDSGATPFGFTVSLEKASALPVTVDYTTADGTANAGTDFIAVAPDSQLTFAPGETSKTITVDVIGDTSIEADESFSVVLSTAASATIVDDTGVGTILDDDAPVPLLVRINDTSLLEGHTGTRGMVFTVTLSAESTLPVSVNFTSADGTATAGTDYTALTPATLTFAPGETTKTITVEVRGDVAAEPSETFSVVLADAVNAVIDDGTGLGTILDDDVTLLGKRKATFTDVDGEQVTIKVSKGTLKVEDFTIFSSGAGAQLALVDFSGETIFSGANLKISAGAGSVDVGAIDARGVDLGKVSVKGDLGRINAGNDADPKPGVRSLRLNSLGHAGIATQLPGGSLQSGIAGMLKSLKLAGGMEDATLLVSDGIGAITIQGNVARAQLLAGYDGSGTPVNGDVSIGRVVVGGDWIASNLIAGVTAGADMLFGTDDDAPISGSTAITSKIASIFIKGSANGTEGGGDHFGFVAEEIRAFKAGGAKLTLTKGAHNDLTGFPVGTTEDLKVREVA